MTRCLNRSMCAVRRLPMGPARCDAGRVLDAGPATAGRAVRRAKGLR